MKITLRRVAAMTFVIGLATPAFGAPHAGGPVMGPAMGPAMHTPAPRALGQPNQSCGSPSALNTPGNAAMAPGSAFNPDGTAGTRYAGQQPQNSRNPASVAQYDAACAHQTR